MKCPKCGAPLQMEDKFCTYCGAPNMLALKHQADMEHYEYEFSKTQEEVLTKSRKAGALAGYLVVIVVMIILNIAAGIVSANAWDIKYERRKQQAARHAEEHIAAIENMIAEQDYLTLREYYFRNNLTDVDELEQYGAVVRYAGCLGELYNKLCDFDSLKYRVADSVRDYDVTYMASNIISLYEDPRSSYYRDKEVTDEKMAVIEDIRSQARAILVTYARFTPEEADQLPNMSKSRVEEMVKEHLEQVLAMQKAAKAAAETGSTESISAEDFLRRVVGGESE